MKAAGTKFVGAIKVAAKLRQPTHPRKIEEKKTNLQAFSGARRPRSRMDQRHPRMLSLGDHFILLVHDHVDPAARKLASP
jgi:hypothetical protein